MKTIGIIGAMDTEVHHLIARMEQSTETVIAGRRFVRGMLVGHDVIVVQSGIGKVAAAITAQILIDHFAVDCLINTGMAGGLDARLATKDLVVGTAAVQHDFDLTAFGHAAGYICGEDDSKATSFPADETLVALALDAAKEVLPADNKAITGLIASGDVFVDDSALKCRIIDSFGAAATEMEGGAIAHVAYDNGVPFLILRTISDLAEHEANISFAALERYVGQLAEDITIALLKRLA